MEAVQLFNEELAGLYDIKPPISKGKMTAITKAAIRAIKYYKHVVQSVEKFIQKCKTEYKIPGLYVIDSIVRQSRHQFSIEKDVFAPRFAKNVLITFFHLFKCPQEDKSKVIRVLNLWQKNQVFGEDIIQPLFDLANSAHPIQKEIAKIIAQKEKKDKSLPQQAQQHPPTPQHAQSSQQQQMLQQQKLQQQQKLAVQQNSHLTVPSSIGASSINTSVGLSLSSSAQVSSVASVVPALDQTFIQQIQQMLMKADDSKVASAVAALGLHGTPKHGIPAVSHSHALPSIAHALSVSSTSLTHTVPLVSHSIPTVQSTHSNASAIPNVQSHMSTIASVPEPQPIGVIGLNQSGDYDGRSLTFLPVDTSQPPPGYLHQGFPPANSNQSSHSSAIGMPPGHSLTTPVQSTMHYEQPRHIVDGQNIQTSPREEGEHTDDSEDNKENQDDREIEHRRSRSRSYSRSRRNRRKSRSRSNSRTHHRRSRSRSRGRRSRSRDKDRDREKDRRDRGRAPKLDIEKEREREKQREQEKEKERDRKKKGLPPIKSNHLSVCSTTLWVGHLSRLVGPDELSDTFGEYGDIVSIDQIPPRGCAFICMNRRQDASRALTKLRNHKLQGKAMTLAWAPGRGVKGKDFKDYWEVDLGCSYVPYDKLKTMSHLDLDSLEEGGMIDEDTVPSWMKGRFQNSNASSSAAPVPVVTNINQPPPTHLPQNLISLGVPPPSGGNESLPSMPPMPPPVNKDVPHARHPLVPPHMMSPFGLHSMPPPPGPGGIPMGTAMMPPNLPPLGVPPPMGMPPMPMLSQSMLRVPPHGNMSHPPPTLVNHNSQDSDNMDVEMEDVDKQDSSIINDLSSPGPLEKEEDDHKGSGLESDKEIASDMSQDGQEVLRNEQRPAGMEDSPFNMPHGDFRGDGYNSFNPARLPIPRPPGFPPLGMMHGNAPNFGPRGLPNMSGYNAPRGLLTPPHMLGGHPPGLLPDMGGGHGMHGIVQMGLSPMGGPNGPMGNQMLGPMHHRGMPGGPGIMNRFAGFPRFGLVSPEANAMPPHPEHMGEHGNWMQNHDGRSNLRSLDQQHMEEKESQQWGNNNLDVLLQQEKTRDKEEDTKDKVKEDIPTKHNVISDLTNDGTDSKLAPKSEHSDTIKLEEKENEIKKSDTGRSRSWTRFQDDVKDRSRSREAEGDRGKDREKDRNRDSERGDRERDRGRDRDNNRDFDYSGHYRNESDRYRDDGRSREHGWGSQWGEDRDSRRNDSTRWNDVRGEREKSRWGDDRREDKTRWGDDRRDDKTRWGDDRREDKTRWGDDRRDDRSRWGEYKREEKPRWGEAMQVDNPQWDSDPAGKRHREEEEGPEFDWNTWNSTSTTMVPPPPKKEKKVVIKPKSSVATVGKNVSNPNHNSLVAIISSLASGKKQGSNSECADSKSTALVETKKSDHENRRSSLVNVRPVSGLDKKFTENNQSVSKAFSSSDRGKSFMDKTKSNSDHKIPCSDNLNKPRTSFPTASSGNPNSLVAIISSLANSKKQDDCSESDVPLASNEVSKNELNSNDSFSKKATAESLDSKSIEKPESFMDKTKSVDSNIKSAPNVLSSSAQRSSAPRVKFASHQALTSGSLNLADGNKSESDQLCISEDKLDSSSIAAHINLANENEGKPNKSNVMAINPHFAMASSDDNNKHTFKDGLNVPGNSQLETSTDNFDKSIEKDVENIIEEEAGQTDYKNSSDGYLLHNKSTSESEKLTNQHEAIGSTERCKEILENKETKSLLGPPPLDDVTLESKAGADEVKISSDGIGGCAVTCNQPKTGFKDNPTSSHLESIGAAANHLNKEVVAGPSEPPFLDGGEIPISTAVTKESREKNISEENLENVCKESYHLRESHFAEKKSDREEMCELENSDDANQSFNAYEQAETRECSDETDPSDPHNGNERCESSKAEVVFKEQGNKSLCSEKSLDAKCHASIGLNQFNSDIEVKHNNSKLTVNVNSETQLNNIPESLCDTVPEHLDSVLQPDDKNVNDIAPNSPTLVGKQTFEEVLPNSDER